MAKVGERLVITAGVPFGTPGSTNILRVAWSRNSRRRAQVAVFNDTARCGISAAMQSWRQSTTTSPRGGSVILRHPVGRSWDDDACAGGDRGSGPGADQWRGHHASRPAGGAALVKLGPHCAALGKPCYLVNATVQQIKGVVPENLAAFTGIWVRDHRSAAELHSLGMAGEMTGDLTYFHDLPRHRPARETWPGAGFRPTAATT
jgi:hypothetical protein